MGFRGRFKGKKVLSAPVKKVDALSARRAEIASQKKAEEVKKK